MSLIPEPPPLDIRLGTEDPRYNLFHGDRTGGWMLTFGKHKESPINEVPYSYLKWCRNNLHDARLYHHVFDQYHEALMDLIDDHYEEFRVPFGKKHKGERLMECCDEPWMVWVLSWANHPERAKVKNKYDVFLEALQRFIDNATPYNGTKDAEETPEPTAAYSEDNPQDSEEHQGEDILNPDEYEDDIYEANEYDEEEYDPQDLIDADENGDLKDFVVPDNLVEYVDERDAMVDLDDESEAQTTPSGSEEEGETVSSTPSDEALDNVSPPQTPKRPRGNPRVINFPPTTDNEDDDDTPSLNNASVRTPTRLKGTFSGATVYSSSDEDEAVPLSELVPQEGNSSRALLSPIISSNAQLSNQDEPVKTPPRSDLTPARKRNCSDGEDSSNPSPKKRVYRAS